MNHLIKAYGHFNSLINSVSCVPITDLMAFRYYRILDLPEDASLDDIKKAYRKKAKKYHPDLNKSPDAHARFIEINEAYEFLIKLKSQPVYSREVFEQQYQEWVEKEREKARARAAYMAKKKFEEFKKSPLYRTSLRLSNIYDSIVLGVAIFILIGALNGIWIQKLFYGLTINSVFAAIILVALSSVLIYFSVRGIKERRKIIRRDFSRKSQK